MSQKELRFPCVKGSQVKILHKKRALCPFLFESEKVSIIKEHKLQTTSFSLHILAMIFMLIDHAGMIFFSDYPIFRCIGRLAFPIFAFMAVEGFYHTRSLKKYLSRLFIWAVISETAYNIFKTGQIVDITRRNVLWTFLFGLILVYSIDKARKKFGDGPILLAILIFSAVFCYCFSKILRADYGYAGLFTVIAFYLFRGRSTSLRLLQFASLFVINTLILSSSSVVIGTVSITRQIFALFALIPIWMYNGKRGYSSKTLTLFYYAFYPLHLILLVVLYVILK